MPALGADHARRTSRRGSAGWRLDPLVRGPPARPTTNGCRISGRPGIWWRRLLASRRLAASPAGPIVYSCSLRAGIIISSLSECKRPASQWISAQFDGICRLSNFLADPSKPIRRIPFVWRRAIIEPNFSAPDFCAAEQLIRTRWPRGGSYTTAAALWAPRRWCSAAFGPQRVWPAHKEAAHTRVMSGADSRRRTPAAVGNRSRRRDN